jgi:hypothetical protein
MLSQDSLNKLMNPIITRQEQINLYVLNLIAARIKEIGTMLPSDVFKLERLLKTGSDVRLINKELARLTGLQEQDIKKLIRIVAADAYVDTRPFYDYRNKPFIPFDSNIQLQRVVNAIAEQTAGTYRNLSKAQAFMIRDLRDPRILIATPAAQAYQSVVDEAVQCVSTGVTDYSSAMRRTLKQLSDSGLRVVYNTESGRTYTQRMDTAVRRNILDGVRAINQGVQDETGKQFGADGKELTVHQYPAEDHAPVQGHQFYNDEYDKMQSGQSFKDIQGRTYEGFKRAIGTLNCRHFAYSIIVGVAKPNYTDAQLQNIINQNEQGYTLPNGKHLTMYECTQRQREMETKIRYAKDGQIAARTAGDIELAREYQAKINRYTQQYEAFSKACGLQEMRNKMTVSGYRKIKVK